MRFWIFLLGVAVASSCCGLAQSASTTLFADKQRSDSILGSSTVFKPIPATDPGEPLETPVPFDESVVPSPDKPGADSNRYRASVYIPLDSWIYPALDRLAALGDMPDSTTMVRPWTRLEAARLVAEAHAQYFEMDETEESLLASLDMEFRTESKALAEDRNIEAQLENIYTRLSGIGGTPLRDGYHFSQTLVNDFGRPYGQGANEISGVAARANMGPLSFYFRGEYQYASELPLAIYDGAAQQALATADRLPFAWNLRLGTTSRPRPIEAYVSLNVHDWQLTFGQQSLWWGPDRSTSLILSNNAASLPMLRLDRSKPGYLPGPLHTLGPTHFDFFIARMGGVHYVELGPTFIPYGSQNVPLTPPPFLWGIHLTVKPTKNFELGLAHTTIFAGYGRPLTFGTFFHSFSILGNGQAVDPGKRVTEVNLSYDIPGLRRAIRVYSEGMAWDDPIEGKFVARYAWNPGIYLPELPKLPNFDARFEAVYTDLPKQANQGYFYANAHYPQGYTNYGQILGSWVGREGIGGQASTTYWFTPQKKVGLFYRKMVSDAFLFGGGRTSDYGVNASWRIRPEIELNALGQYETWKFPILQQNSRSNFTGTAEFRFYPAAEFHSRSGK